MLKEKYQKLLSVVSGLSLLFNSFITPISVVAQDITPTDTPVAQESTLVTPTPEITQEDAPEATEVLPTVVLDPVEEPTVTPEPTEEVIPADELTTTPAAEETPTPTLEPTPLIISEEPVLSASDTSQPTGEPVEETQVTPSPEVDPNLLPTPPPVEEPVVPVETLAAVIVDGTVNTEDPNFDFSVVESSSATLTTDKSDYAPTETVLIYGENYNPNTIYILEIISDAGDYTFSTEVKSTETGTIEYSHQLDGTYRPNYTVTVKDTNGDVIARTQFTDTKPEDINFSGVVTTNSLINNSCILDVTNQYSDLNCTANDIELASPSVNIIDGCDSPSDHATFDFYVDVRNNAQDRFDVGVWISTDGDPNHDGSYSGLCSVSDLTIPPAFNLDSDVCGDVQNTPNPVDISHYYIGQLTLLCSDTDYNGQLDVPIVTSWSNSSNNICTGPLETVPQTKSKCKSDLTFNIPVPVPGQIIVKKETNPDGSPQPFDFTIIGPADGGFDGSDNFQLADGGTWDSGTVYAGGLKAGTYNVTETVLNNWDLTSVVCSDGSPSNAIVLSPGETITCTYTNTLKSATLTLVKTVINDNGGTATTSSFQAYIGSTPISWSTPITLNTGSYKASETLLPGYSASVWGGDCAADGTITLNPGDNKTCTITNDDITPSLKLVKSVTNDNGGTTTADNWDLTATGSVLGFTDKGDSTSFHTVKAGVEYTLTESVISGYTMGTWDCTGGTLVGNKITLGLNEDVTCTITNNDNQAYITVIKIVTKDNGGNAQPNDFKLTLEGSAVLSGVANPVNPGTYTAAETLLPGYSFTSFSGDCDTNGDVSVALGESKTCTLTNDDVAPKLTLIKDPTNNNGGNAQPNDFKLTIGGNAATSGVAYALSANTPYAINETQLTGYTFVSITGDTKCPSVLGGTVTLDEGDDITCTITNDDVAPKLTLVKTVINDNGGKLAVSDFPLFINGTAATSGTAYDQTANVELTASETTKTGYTPSVWGEDCSQDGKITLLPGDNKTCTITNDDVAPTLRLVKNVITDDGGKDVAGDWTLTARVDQTIVISDKGDSTTFHPVTAGVTYILEEVGPVGYSHQGWSCDGGTYEPSLITLGLGENVTCTVTNDDVPGMIYGYKFADDGETGLPGWTINLYDCTENNTFVLEDCTFATSTTTDSEGYYEFEDLVAGKYIVKEVLQNGWEILSPANNQYNVTVQLATQSPDNNFINFELGKIAVCKLIDNDADADPDDQDPVNTPLAGVTINLYQLQNIEDPDTIGEPTSILIPGYVWIDSQVTPESGCVTFEGLHYGWYKVDEGGMPGYYPTYPTVSYYDDILVASGYDNSQEPFIFLNAGYSSIGDTIWLDTNENGVQDGESGIEGVTVYLYKDDGDGIFEPDDPISGPTADEYIGTRTTDVDGVYIFQMLVHGDYWVDPDPSSPALLGLALTTSNTPYFVDELMPGVVDLTADFGYRVMEKGITLTKSNNKPNAGAGDTVTYTLTITNSGELTLTNIILYDVLPGGFTYVSGSTTIDGAASSDPTNSGGKLYWNVGSLDASESVVVVYRALMASDLKDGKYTNVAVCTSLASREILVECNTATSIVEIGQNVDISGSVKGQVLGYVLPATGSPTWMLLIIVTMLFAGTALRVVSYSQRKHERSGK